MSKRFGVDLPSTLERSSDKAQRTYAKTLRSAERSYGSGERSSRTAFGALKHGFEKVDDHWESKAHKGPSDPQSARSGAAARAGGGKSYHGVDGVGHTRQQLYERARRLDIAGRSRMTKSQLAEAIGKKQK